MEQPAELALKEVLELVEAAALLVFLRPAVLALVAVDRTGLSVLLVRPVDPVEGSRALVHRVVRYSGRDKEPDHCSDKGIVPLQDHLGHLALD